MGQQEEERLTNRRRSGWTTGKIWPTGVRRDWPTGMRIGRTVGQLGQQRGVGDWFNKWEKGFGNREEDWANGERIGPTRGRRDWQQRGGLVQLEERLGNGRRRDWAMVGRWEEARESRAVGSTGWGDWAPGRRRWAWVTGRRLYHLLKCMG